MNEKNILNQIIKQAKLQALCNNMTVSNYYDMINNRLEDIKDDKELSSILQFAQDTIWQLDVMEE